MSEVTANDYGAFLIEVKTRIRKAINQISNHWLEKSVGANVLIMNRCKAYRDALPSPEAIAERLRLWSEQETEG